MRVSFPVTEAVELDEISLAFLLSIVSAPRQIAGIDEGRIAALREADDADRRGREALAAQGLLRVEPEGDRLDPRLPYLAAIAATPTAVVEAQAAGRYLCFSAAQRQIVEIGRLTTDRYLLRGLTDTASVIDRVAALAGIAQRGDRAEAARLDRTEFLEHHDTADAMTALGLPAAGIAASQLDREPGWVVRGELTAVGEAVRRCRVAGLRDPDLIVCAVDPDAVDVSRDPAYAATAIAALTDAVIGPVVSAG